MGNRYPRIYPFAHYKFNFTHFRKERLAITYLVPENIMVKS
jgi:hypothetical protein